MAPNSTLANQRSLQLFLKGLTGKNVPFQGSLSWAVVGLMLLLASSLPGGNLRNSEGGRTLTTPFKPLHLALHESGITSRLLG